MDSSQMSIFNQIHDEINKLKVPDENLCDGDLDDYPEIYYNKASDDCLTVLEKYKECVANKRLCNENE